MSSCFECEFLFERVSSWFEYKFLFKKVSSLIKNWNSKTVIGCTLYLSKIAFYRVSRKCYELGCVFYSLCSGETKGQDSHNVHVATSIGPQHCCFYLILVFVCVCVYSKGPKEDHTKLMGGDAKGYGLAYEQKSRQDVVTAFRTMQSKVPPDLLQCVRKWKRTDIKFIYIYYLAVW